MTLPPNVTLVTLTKFAGVLGLLTTAGYYVLAKDDLATATSMFFTAMAIGGVSLSQGQTHAQIRDVKTDLTNIIENPAMPGTPTDPTRE